MSSPPSWGEFGHTALHENYEIGSGDTLPRCDSESNTRASLIAKGVLPTSVQKELSSFNSLYQYIWIHHSVLLNREALFSNYVSVNPPSIQQTTTKPSRCKSGGRALPVRPPQWEPQSQSKRNVFKAIPLAHHQFLHLTAVLCCLRLMAKGSVHGRVGVMK